ncbi:hypothetical protein B4Q13_20315, partial [Lacticaseibacillus rhamnosus]
EGSGPADGHAEQIGVGRRRIEVRSRDVVTVRQRVGQLDFLLAVLEKADCELLLAGAILWFVGPDRLLSRSADHGLIAWQSLALAATIQGVLNLIPHTIQTPAGNIPNDGSTHKPPPVRIGPRELVSRGRFVPAQSFRVSKRRALASHAVTTARKWRRG